MVARLRTLEVRDRLRLEEFLALRPVENLFLAAKVWANGVDRRRLGRVHAWEVGGEIAAVLLDSGTLFIGGQHPAAIGDFVRSLGGIRRCTSILGPAMMALGLYTGLSERYGGTWRNCSNIRRNQPLMVLEGKPLVDPDRRVRRLGEKEYRSYLEASVHMYTDEIGSSPFKYGGGYDKFVRERLQVGDAWGIVEDGMVIFKADLGPKMPGHAQIQGVWVKPELRGQGISSPALSGMLEQVMEQYPTISLYVNDFNVPAVRSYERLGFQQVGALATVHY